MKDLDTAGAPMISVPAGILKEFMSPSNSRTPTPPMVTSAVTTTTPSEVTTSNSQSPSPASNMTNGIAKSMTPTSTSRTSSPMLPTEKSSSSLTSSSASPVPILDQEVQFKDEDQEMLSIEKSSTSLTSSSASPVHMNGDQEVKVKDEHHQKEVKKILQDDILMNGNADSPKAHSPSNHSNGVKRSNDDDDIKPDLKKIRVLPSLNKDGFKNLNITGKEVNKALDLEAKKFEELDKNNQQSLVTLSRIKNRIAKLPRDTLSNTDSIPHSPASIPSPSPSTPLPQEVSAPITTPTPTPDTPVQPSSPATQVDTTDKENVRATRGKQSKLTKKTLKDAILRAFSENSLYNAEVGHLKQMCEKLTSTLEINMRKVAQFHKEIEDLRKVTTRLAAEHQARKGQYVAPIRIKRSVGIQAAPHIINKGIMHANVSGGNIRTIAPRNSNMMLQSSIGQNLVPGNTPLGFLTTSPGIVKSGPLTGISATAPIMSATAASLGTAVRTPSGQIVMMNPAPTMQPLTRPPAGTPVTATGALPTPTMVPVTSGRVVRAPVGNLGAVTSQQGTMIGAQRSILLQNEKGAGIPGVPATLQTLAAPGKSGGVIDLTDEDEAKGTNRTVVGPKPGTLVKVPTTATAQLLPLQGGGMGQVVLLPNTSGGQPTTALIVSQVSTGQSLESIGNPAVAQARISTVVNHTPSTPRVQGTPPAPLRTTPNPTPTTTVQQTNSMKHPAPLPKTPFQQVGGISKKLPPQPTLRLSHKDSSIVLSWTMAKTEDHECIASYQLYAYQEGAAPPSANLWKKVGSVKALELPMACTLTQFMPGHVYHFAVRAVDTKSRLGPFSEPRSIRLDKK